MRLETFPLRSKIRLTLKTEAYGGRLKNRFQTASIQIYSGLNLNQDKATKPQTVQIVRQGKVTPYWFKVNPGV